MGLQVKKALVFLLMMAVCGLSKGAVFKVGDSAGWTHIGHVDYKTWAATKNFHVGDTFFFQYNNQFHNVVRVTHKNFNACNATAPYATLTSGNDSFTVKRGGHFYFICSFPGHCEAGQRVDIRVPRYSLLTPIPVPSPSPNLLPSPTPSLSPSPSPSPSPSASDVPAPPHNGASYHVPSCKFWLMSMVILAFCASGFVY